MQVCYFTRVFKMTPGEFEAENSNDFMLFTLIQAINFPSVSYICKWRKPTRCTLIFLFQEDILIPIRTKKCFLHSYTLLVYTLLIETFGEGAVFHVLQSLTQDSFPLQSTKALHPPCPACDSQIQRLSPLWQHWQLRVKHSSPPAELGRGQWLGPLQ